MQKWIPKLTLLTINFMGLALAGGGSRLVLRSPDFNQGDTLKMKQVYNGFGCEGGNLSPALTWSGAPTGTQSFGLTVHDPDAPVKGGWWHWVVYNLPAQTKGLPAGAGEAASTKLPKGTLQGVTNFDQAAYGGPCPPQGNAPHHYNFTLYALNVAKLNVAPTASAAEIRAQLLKHSLAQVTLTGRYGR